MAATAQGSGFCARKILDGEKVRYTEYDVERYFREIQIARIAPVSAQLILSHIGERVLGLPKSY